MREAADNRVVAHRHRLDVGVDGGQLRAFAHACGVVLRIEEADVVFDGAGEHLVVLQHHANAPAEGGAPAAERLEQLESYRQELRHLEAGKDSAHPVFRPLAVVIQERQLPFKPFHDLLDAFSQDVVKSRYADFNEVMHYCSRSADPVGRLMLHLYRAADEENLPMSDAICSALQLINFWQDVAVDLKKDRIYLPQDEMALYDVNQAQLARGETNAAWRQLMSFQVERARGMLQSGAPLAKRLPGRIGLELRMIVQGGLRIAEKLVEVDYDVFRRRRLPRRQGSLSGFTYHLLCLDTR